MYGSQFSHIYLDVNLFENTKNITIILVIVSIEIKRKKRI